MTRERCKELPVGRVTIYGPSSHVFLSTGTLSTNGMIRWLAEHESLLREATLLSLQWENAYERPVAEMELHAPIKLREVEEGQ
jgi:hypothetical protein